MICSKSKEGAFKSSEQHDCSYKNRANHSWKLCNTNEIKAVNHILVHVKSEGETPKSSARNAIQGAF